MAKQSRSGQPANYNATPEQRIDGEATGFETDSYGNQLVSLATALQLLVSGVETDTVGTAPFRRSDSFNTVPTDTQASTAQVVKAAVANKTIYVTDITISTDGGAVCNVIIQDDAGTPLKIEKVFLPATATTIVLRYVTPKPLTSGQALNYIASSATPHISVSAAGYAI